MTASPTSAEDRIALPGGWYFQVNPDRPAIGMICHPEDGPVSPMTTDWVRLFAKDIARPAAGDAALADVERLLENWKRAIIDNRTCVLSAAGLDAVKAELDTALAAQAATLATLRRQLSDRNAEVAQLRAIAEAAREWTVDRTIEGLCEKALFVAVFDAFPDDFPGREACPCGESDTCDECSPLAAIQKRIKLWREQTAAMGLGAATATSDHGGRRG